MANPYRFGGPIPESVQRLKSRREYRASSLHAGVKKIRRERFESERASASASSGVPVGADAPSPTSAAHCGEHASRQAARTPSSPR